MRSRHVEQITGLRAENLRAFQPHRTTFAPPAGTEHHLSWRARPSQRGEVAQTIGIHHRHVVHPLIHEHPLLCHRVIAHRSVAVQMVGRHVEHHAHSRLKSLDPFQLKRTDFQHHRIKPPDFRALRVIVAQQIANRAADISSRRRGNSAGLQHSGAQFRCGRLAVGACNSNHRTRAETKPKLQFADHRHTCAFHGAK